VTCGGGKYFYEDDQQTPDTQVATFDFPGTCLLWEHRIWSKTGYEGESWGVALYGEKGTLVFDRKGWHVIDGVEASDQAGEMELAHKRDFLDCIKEHRRPRADIEDGHRSTSLCHLGNIAWRVGRTLRWDGKAETILGDAEANQLLGREYRQGFEVPRV
jgi:hypothetical protein